MRRSSHTSQKGFTIAEVMVAVLVMSVSAFAVLTTMMFAKQVQTEEVRINEATEIAQGVLESFRKTPYITLEELVTPGSYALETIGTVYDEDLNPHEVIEPGLLYQVRSRLDEWRLAETIVVEKADDAMRVSIRIHTYEDTQRPLVAMATYIVQNGINFN